jgi:hypothetical protein
LRSAEGVRILTGMAGLASAPYTNDETYRSEALKYELYCFHPSTQLDDACRMLEPDRRRSNILALSGAPASGRQYFIEAAAHLACNRGLPVSVMPIDLEGYEGASDAERLAAYAKFQIDQRKRHEDSTRDAIVDAVRGLGALAKNFGGAAAAAVSAILALPEPVRALRGILRPSNPSATVVADHSMLDRLLEIVDGRIIFHIRDMTHLDATVRDWFLNAAAREARILLVLSCAPGERERAVGRHWVEAEEIWCKPIGQRDLKRMLIKRFVGHCPPDLIEGVWRYSKGVPGHIASKMRELVRKGILYEHAAGGWEITDRASTELERALTASYFQPIVKALDSLGADARAAHEFLLLAALCGRQAPCRVLLASLGAEGDEQERLVDVIDEHFTEDGPEAVALFDDFPSGTPDFPDMPAYAFKSRLAACAILDHRHDNKIREAAKKLLAFATANLPKRTPGICRMLLTLAKYGENKRVQEELERELAWWVRQEDCDALIEALCRDVEQGLIEWNNSGKASRPRAIGRRTSSSRCSRPTEGVPAFLWIARSSSTPIDIPTPFPTICLRCATPGSSCSGSLTYSPSRRFGHTSTMSWDCCATIRPGSSD